MNNLFKNMDRRTFMQTAAAAGVVAGSMGMRSIALASDGGTFTFGRTRETSHLDPHRSQLSSSWHIQHMVYDSLVTLDDNFDVQPQLAESWEWQGNDLTFTIRKGVKFANGREMTMDDVVGSLNRALKSKGNPWGLLLRNKTGITSSGNKLTISFSGPNNVALTALTATLVCIIPMKEVEDGSWDPNTDQFLGTGPFYVTNHVANDRWELAANPHYWGGKQGVSNVVVRTIPEVNSLVAALRDGSIDAAAFDSNPDAPDLIAGEPNISSATMNTTDFNYVGMNAISANSPFTDIRVRQAVALVLDRQKIVDFAFGGRAEITYGWTQWGLTDDSKLKFRDPDVERAKALIAEADPKVTSFPYLVRGGSNHGQIAQVVKQQLALIGLDAQLETVDGGVWAKRVWGTRPESDMIMTNSAYTGFAHPLVTAHWWAPDLSRFTGGYVPENPDYTAALNDATTAAADSDVVPSLQRLYEIYNEQAIKIPLCVNTETIAWRSDRVDMTPSNKQAQNDIINGVENYKMKV